MLAEGAKKRQDNVGWKIVFDAGTGVRLGVPAKLVPQQSSDANGVKWNSTTGTIQIQMARRKETHPTTAKLAEQEKKEPAGRKIDYSVVKPDFFVLSGMQGLKKFYLRGQVKDDEVRILTILYNQATDPQPMLPLGLGYVEGVTHDYVRHGTTTLFAALNVLNGAVLAECKPRHRHQEFVSFLRTIDQSVPAELDIHCIVDNYATHSHPKVRAWLAARPRWHMHFIPTYSSWLNQVERFFGLITDKAIRRGSFSSVKDLVNKIDHFVASYNTNCKPFTWTASADSILEKLHRLCSRISGTAH